MTSDDAAAGPPRPQRRVSRAASLDPAQSNHPGRDGGRQRKGRAVTGRQQKGGKAAEGEAEEDNLRVPRPPKPTHDVMPYTPEGAVGHTVLVFFYDVDGKEPGQFYEGRIEAFNTTTGKHTVVYADEVIDQDLAADEYVIWSGSDWTSPATYITGRNSRWPEPGAEPGMGALTAAAAAGEEKPVMVATAAAAALGSPPEAAEEGLAAAGSMELTSRKLGRARRVALQQLHGEEAEEASKTGAAARAAKRRKKGGVHDEGELPSPGAAEHGAGPAGQPAASPEEELMDDEDDEAPLEKLVQQAQQGHGAAAGARQQQQKQGEQQGPAAEPEKGLSQGLPVRARQVDSGAQLDAAEQQQQQQQQPGRGAEQAPGPAELVDLSGLRDAEGAQAMDLDAARGLGSQPAPEALAPPQAACGASSEQGSQQQQQAVAAAGPHKIRIKRRRSDALGPAAAALEPLGPAVREEAPAPAAGAAAGSGAVPGKGPASRRKDRGQLLKEKGPQAAAPASPPSVKKERPAEARGAGGPQAPPASRATSAPAPHAQAQAARASVTPKAQQPLGMLGDDLQELRQLQERLQAQTHQLATSQGQAAAAARAVKATLGTLRDRGVTVEQLQATQQAAALEGGKGLGRAVAQVSKEVKKLAQPVVEVLGDELLAAALPANSLSELSGVQQRLQQVEEAGESSRALVDEWKTMANAPAPRQQAQQAGDRGQQQQAQQAQHKKAKPSPGPATVGGPGQPGVGLRLFQNAAQVAGSQQQATQQQGAGAGAAMQPGVGPGSSPHKGTLAKAESGGAEAGPVGGKEEEDTEQLFESTGSLDRDRAILVLAAALAGPQRPFSAAVELEQALFEKHPPQLAGQPPQQAQRGGGGARCSEQYLQELRALWEALSPQAPQFRPLLRYLLLSGELPPAELVVALPQQIQLAEANFLTHARQRHEGSGFGGSNGTAGSGRWGGINRELAKLPPAPPAPEQQQQHPPPQPAAGAPAGHAAVLAQQPTAAPARGDPAAVAKAVAARLTAQKLAEVGLALPQRGPWAAAAPAAAAAAEAPASVALPPWEGGMQQPAPPPLPPPPPEQHLLLLQQQQQQPPPPFAAAAGAAVVGPPPPPPPPAGVPYPAAAQQHPSRLGLAADLGPNPWLGAGPRQPSFPPDSAADLRVATVAPPAPVTGVQEPVQAPAASLAAAAEPLAEPCHPPTAATEGQVAAAPEGAGAPPGQAGSHALGPPLAQSAGAPPAPSTTVAEAAAEQVAAAPGEPMESAHEGEEASAPMEVEAI